MPDAEEATYSPPANIVDDIHDKPIGILESSGLKLSPIVFGAAPLSTIYNSTDHLVSDIPIRTVRLALRYGINTFDTSPYYGNSEITLGAILRGLREDHPRSSYYLASKCGRYGQADFDYSPATIRESLARSLRRLGTDYLDIFYLHDIEFVATRVQPADAAGDPSLALSELNTRQAWGLEPEDAAKIRGDGDQRILDAYGELRRLRDEGLVHSIGITGYPLPVLLRIALLIKHHFNEPVDSLLSYSNYTLQNTSFAQYLPEFKLKAGIRHVQTASPLNMGFFAPNGPPSWHPSRQPKCKGLLEARAEVLKLLGSKNPIAAQDDNLSQVPTQSNSKSLSIADLAIGFALRRSAERSSDIEAGPSPTLPSDVPTVIGLSTLAEVHEGIRIWREVNKQTSSPGEEIGSRPPQDRVALEDAVMECFERAGFKNWSPY